MGKNNNGLSGKIYIVDGSKTKLWFELDEEHHAEFFLNDEETEKIKKQMLDHLKHTSL